MCESVLVRIDAGFPDGETLKGLETQSIDYVARIRNNAVLDRMAQPYLRRPRGRFRRVKGGLVSRAALPGRQVGARAAGGAGGGPAARRVVRRSLLVDHSTCEPTATAARGCWALYRMRGKAEGHMGELIRTC